MGPWNIKTLSISRLTFLELLLTTPELPTSPLDDESSTSAPIESSPQSIPPKSDISSIGGTGDLEELAAMELLGVGKAVNGVGRVERGRAEVDDDEKFPAHSSESRGGAV